jgi:hypothetical protein
VEVALWVEFLVPKIWDVIALVINISQDRHDARLGTRLLLW